jgi:hypothetical protein
VLLLSPMATLSLSTTLFFSLRQSHYSYETELNLKFGPLDDSGSATTVPAIEAAVFPLTV